jgi:hypothetical protein
MKFDPQSAAPIFARKESDELIRIAFLEESYVEEAKELARRELARRGLSEISKEGIERVKTDVNARKAAAEEHNLRSLELDEAIPSWRRVARARVAPYRQILSLAALASLAVFGLSSMFEWELLNLNSRHSRAFALLIALAYMFFVAPTRSEFRKRGGPNDAPDR